MFARVSFPISSFRYFTYKIPASFKGTVQPGTCVNAPINRRMQAGFVVAVNPDSEYKGKILSIDSIREKEFQFPEELWYEVLLRYGLYVGAVFQLVCILAVIVLPPLKEGPESLTGVNTSYFNNFSSRNFQSAMYRFSLTT